VPTGTITVNLGSLSQNVMLIPGGLTTQSLNFMGTPVMSGEAVFQNLPAGIYPVSATYAGDTNSLPTTSAAPNPRFGPPPIFTVVASAPPAPLLPTTTTMSVQPPSFDDTLWLDFGITATVTGPTGSNTPPTGFVDIFEDGVEIADGPLTPSGPNSATLNTTAEGLSMDVGSSQLKAVYSGDSVYQSSAFLESYQFTINTTAPDFLLAPQLPQITVQPGSSGTVGVNLASIGGYSGAVNLSCTTSSSLLMCSLNPATVTVNGQVATTLTINAAAKTTALAAPQPQGKSRWPVAAGIFCFGLLFIGKRGSRKPRLILLFTIALPVAFIATGCNEMPKHYSGIQEPAPTLVTYNVVVTGTANGIVHNAKITVLVQ